MAVLFPYLGGEEPRMSQKQWASISSHAEIGILYLHASAWLQVPFPSSHSQHLKDAIEYTIHTYSLRTILGVTYSLALQIK